MRSGGGGGYGDPLTRDVALVAADVRAGIVSARAAEISYGVLLDGHGRADEAATRARREEIRARRLTWDREGDRLVRRSPAAARLIERDQWCAARDGVELHEYADPDTGELLRTEIVVNSSTREPADQR
jgi:N-methylhydantoinase B